MLTVCPDKNKIKLEVKSYNSFCPNIDRKSTFPTTTVLVNGNVLLGTVLREQAVGILMDTQFIEGAEVLAAKVATVAQLLLMVLDVLQEGIQLLECLSTTFHNTLVNLHMNGDRRMIRPVTLTAYHHENKQTLVYCEK